MIWVRIRYPVLVLALVMFAGPAAAAEKAWMGPIIDAHSQIDQHVARSEIVPVMDGAGVAHVILAARGKVKPGQIARLADAHPTRITASVRTKGKVFANNHPKYYKLLNVQKGMPQFKAMAEIILWHAQKGNKAPKWVVPAASPQAQAALDLTYDRGWPAVLHYEFRAAGSESDGLFAELRGLLEARPDHPFVLTHMGQVTVDQAKELLANHPNIHFIPSWSNTLAISKTGQPWTDLFDGRRLADDWKALITAYPGQFILGFDNVFSDHWEVGHYGEQVTLWREALAELPDSVAHDVAHRNAERLWKLAPL